MNNTFSFSLSKKTLTSAGIFDSSDKLVKTLWSTKRLESGDYTITWDGLNNEGNEAIDGNYFWKVFSNDSKYVNVGTIGNSGTPPTTFGHTPIHVEGIALDSSDNIYTVHDWDEAHCDVIKRDKNTGLTLLNTFQVLSGYNLKGITVEPDGSFAYVCGYGGDLNDRSQSKFGIFKIDLINNKVLYTFDVYNGGAQYPNNATDKDKDLMRTPLLSMAMYKNSFYVNDSLGGRIIKYDKSNGSLQQVISDIPLVCGIAIDSQGNIWACHEYSKVSIYRQDGSKIKTVITDLTEVRSVSVYNNLLCVADRIGKIKKYNISADLSVSLISSFGNPQRIGETFFDRLDHINCAVIDSSGNIIISDRLGQGTRLQKINSSLSAQLWQQLSLEFSSSGVFLPNDPTTFISSFRHFYSINQNDGSWIYKGCGRFEDRLTKSYYGWYENSDKGPIKILNLNGLNYVFYPTGEDVGIIIYRIDPNPINGCGPILKPVSCLAGNSPLPNGSLPPYGDGWQPNYRYLWDWQDKNANGIIESSEVNIFKTPPPVNDPWEWQRSSISIDQDGNLWLSSLTHWAIPGAPNEQSCIYKIPIKFDEFGNPYYKWQNAIRIIGANEGRMLIGVADNSRFEYKAAVADKNIIYALVISNKNGTADSGGSWMAGNILFAFDYNNSTHEANLKWYVILPSASVGISPIENGGGVLIGAKISGTVGHYNANGLLVGEFQSDEKYGIEGTKNIPSGGLDTFLAINSARSAIDNKINVFVEENYNQRIFWYTIDDKLSEQNNTLILSNNTGNRKKLTVNNGIGSGQYLVGDVVHIAADPAPEGMEFINWTNLNNNDAITSFTMPNNDLVISANYFWKKGDDKIRIFPAGDNGNDVNRLKGCIFEGSNQDKINGPYNIFYIIPVVPNTNQWYEASVNMNNYRYLRFRDPISNGSIAELEFYRKGVKITGETFGTPGSWNNDPNRTYIKVFDGDTSTNWNGAQSDLTYVGIDSGNINTNDIAIIKAYSRRKHGSRGNFDIPVSFSDGDVITDIPVECRGGTNQMIVVEFDREVISLNVSFEKSIGKKAELNNIIYENNKIVINLKNVSDAQLLKINLNDIETIDGISNSSFTLKMKILTGDIDGDGIVSQIDKIIMESYLWPNEKSFRIDINNSGNFTDIDLQSVKNRLGWKIIE